MAAADHVTGPLVVAIPIAAAAGLVSFLSPCVLPLVPGYLSIMTGIGGAAAAVDRPTRQGGRRAVWAALLFIGGFTVVFVSYGALFGGLGSALREHARTLEIIFGSVTVVLGLAFMGLLEWIPLANRELRVHGVPRAGLVGAPVLGAMFGLGWTPCIGPTLSAVLGLAAASDGATAGRGALLALVYCLGLGLPFLVAAVAFEHAMRAFGVVRRHYRAVMVAGGAMLVLLGLAEVTGVWNEWIQRLQDQAWSIDLPL